MDTVHCRVMKKTDEHSAVACIVQAFTQSEPMSSFLQIDPKLFTYFVKQLFSDIVAEELSIVACDEEENIIGVRLVSEYSFIPERTQSSLAHIPESIRAILALLDSLHPVLLPAERCIHLKMMGVNADARNLGVAQKLLLATFAQAKNKGYDYAIVEASSDITQHIFINKFQFTVLKKVHYQTFQFENKTIFAQLPNVTHCALLGKFL